MHKLLILLSSSLTMLSSTASAQSDGKNLTLLGIPSATTAPSGIAFGQVSRTLGIGREDDIPFIVDNDSGDRTVLAFGVGFGDANDGIGGQLTVVGGPSSDDFDSFTYGSVKLSRRINSFSDPTYVALQVDRIAGSGEASDLDPAVSLLFTKFGETASFPYMLTIGANNRARNDGEDPGLLFGAGMGVTQMLGVSGAWSGEHIDLGASLRFESLENARVAIVLSDAFDMEDRRAVTVGLSWSVDLGFGR